MRWAQVKGEQPNQLWSISKLCQQDSMNKNKKGTSFSIDTHRRLRD
jgi:hypothetical protein